MKLFKWLCITGLLLATTACEKDVPGNQNLQQIEFSATLEPLQSGDPNAKVYLHNEEWIYWELGDAISLGSDKCSEPVAATLVNSSPGSDFEDFNGVFVASMPNDSKYFLGLHPKRDENVIVGTSNSETFPTVQIYMPQTQPRRMDGKEDITFAKQVFPMVAWYGGHWDENPGSTPFNLNFHALAGIVRLELFNASGSTATVDNISFQALDDDPAYKEQIWGQFNVRGYKTFSPYVEATNTSNNTVILAAPTTPFAPNSLQTFYLLLPSYDGSIATQYHLRMTVNSDLGSFTKDFKVPVRRNGITNMNALGVTDWASAPTTVGLAGHGTQERPFKIYTVADLVYLRECYNSPGRRINGQEITENTYISLMRSDIELTTSNWNGSSINNFVGHFTDMVHSSSTPGLSANAGITNKSAIPIFENIEAGGVVTDLTVKTDGTVITTTSVTGVSPFCNINRGIIKDCHVRGTVSASESDIAGIAAQNLGGGQIIGSSCEASLTAAYGKSAAGICLHNVASTINGCYATTTITVNAVNAAGICYDNRGRVEDSYFSATIAEGANANWGAIVFENGASGNVKNCYYDGSIVTTGTVAGIVHTMSGAGDSVNYCRMEGSIRGTGAAGVAYNVSNGTLINCYVNSATASVTVTTTAGAQYGGGLVGVLSGGAVENSFVHIIAVSSTTSGPVLGGLVSSVTGGTINNCYSYENSTHTLYGSKSGSPTFTNCYLVNYTQEGVIQQNTPLTSAFATTLTNNKPANGLSWTILPYDDYPSLVQ